MKPLEVANGSSGSEGAPSVVFLLHENAHHFVEARHLEVEKRPVVHRPSTTAAEGLTA